MILSSRIAMISQNYSCQLSKLPIAASYSDKNMVTHVGISLSYFRKIKKSIPKTIAASYGTYSCQR